MSTAPAQLGLEGMPARLFSCTPTRLTTWQDCPRRYRFNYVDRPTPPKGPPWAHNSVGSSAHNALRAWWDLPVAYRTPESAGNILERDWLEDGFRDAEQSALWRAKVRSMVESYVATLDPYDEPRGVERVVATRTDRVAVQGRVDRIDLRPVGDSRRELVVVDYKTGRRAPDTHDVRSSLALALYVLAARRTLREDCNRVELHHLPTGRVVAWEHTEESLARHLRRAEAIAGEASAAEATAKSMSDEAELEAAFPARPGPQCGWCDFSRHCSEGRGAADRKKSWAALAQVEHTEVGPGV